MRIGEGRGGFHFCVWVVRDLEPCGDQITDHDDEGRHKSHNGTVKPKLTVSTGPTLARVRFDELYARVSACIAGQ